MATGKTHSRHFRLLVDEVDLSGDARGVGDFGSVHEEDDVTGWSDAIKNYLLSRLSAYINGFQAVFNNTASTGSHTELKDREEYLVSLLIGIRAAPAAGDPCFSCPLEQKSYTAEGAGPALVSADFVGPGQGHTLPSKVWGAVLAYAAALSATTNGTSVDNGASSANGVLGYLHITVSSGGTWAFKIQDSPDNNTWADLITFSSDGSAVAAEQGSASGTVDRYTRLVSTRTSGTVTVSATIIRL